MSTPPNSMFDRGPKTAVDARYDAQRIAFAPVVFQAARVLRDRGVLRHLLDAGDAGCTLAALGAATSLSPYALTVLLETALSAEIVARAGTAEDPVWIVTKVGYFLERDRMTRVNFRAVKPFGSATNLDINAGYVSGTKEVPGVDSGGIT